MASSLLSRRLLSRRLLPSASLRRLSSDPSPSIDSSFPSDDPTPTRPQARTFEPRQLEGGMDPGIYKAILVGKVGQPPIEKRLKSGTPLVLFSLGTGGIRNNRRPLPDERPEEYSDRCSVQWHRVCVYPERLTPLAMKFVKPGAIIYVEGNLETKVFSDPARGLVRRIREIAIRGDGRLLYLGTDTDIPEIDREAARGVGYY
ncbi:hypothetical protein LUZ60_000697 [Juncus effusus]|nr:hypothetical protein LUZ60_000697 [Juncus effusus]